MRSIHSANEYARLDEQAKGYFELMHNRIVHAPLKEPRKMIDVGCGTGIVTRYLAQRYPSAKVFGVDISPVPTVSDSPDNVEFLTGDIKNLVNGDHMVSKDNDYVFQRLLVLGMTDWPDYIRQMAATLRSGGYLEIHDYADIWYRDSASAIASEAPPINEGKWQRAMQRGAEQLGLDLEIGNHAAHYMKEAGLVDVQVAKYKLPLGTWLADERPETRNIGEQQLHRLQHVFVEHALPGVTRTLSLSKDEMDDLKRDHHDSFKDEGRYFWWFYAVWGRKL